MYILQNAWQNIGRNKGRNILMGVIILAIIATASIALIISNTAGGIIDNYKQRFGSEVTISVNMERIQPVTSSDGQGRSFSRMMMPDQPSPEQYLAFGDSDYLQEAHYNASVFVHNSDYLNFIDESKGGGMGGAGGVMMYRSIGGGDEPEGQYYANLMAYNTLPDEFKDGTRILIEGEYPENDGECIISRELLENSGLKIGDAINLTSSLRERGAIAMPGEEDTSETLEISYELIITGYYEDLTEEYNEMAKTYEMLQNASTNRRNEILTTIGTIIEPMRDGFDGIAINAKFYLADPGNLEAFAAELYSKGLSEDFNVATDEASYNTIVKPVEGLKGVTVVFLAVVLILGAVILILLSSIAIRERKYEIGVLRAMGMKKTKVAAGLLSEMVIITLACLILGLGTGIAAAQPVSDILLDGQIQQIEENNNNTTAFGPAGGPQTIRAAGGMRIGGGFGPGMSAPAEALKEMDVNLNIITIAQIILVALGLAVTASIVGITHVTRYEPIKILSDRN